MTSEELIERNRLNAQNSTGPKTAQGKTVSSQNARRHGLTSKSSPSSIGTWLSVILEKPEIEPRDMYPDHETGQAALVLAEAEARLLQAETALHDFEMNADRMRDHQEDTESAAELLMSLIQTRMCTQAQLDAGARLLQTFGNPDEFSNVYGGKRHQLLKRYVREAQTGRRRALRRWLEVSDKPVRSI